MWNHYFGDRCHLYGVDIQEACRAYEDERTTILVGDQADREFCKTVRSRVPRLDILIDDGGHGLEQQLVTLEEMLPHLRPGGVYVCEDVTGAVNSYMAYVSGLAANLNAFQEATELSRPHAVRPTQLQQEIGSIHCYPFLTVIERTPAPVDMFVSTTSGTEWQAW
jgi:hypothetical protein